MTDMRKITYQELHYIALIILFDINDYCDYKKL